MQSKVPEIRDPDYRKGVVETDAVGNNQVSFTGQLPHRTEDALLKEFDSEFPG